jgi:hypothetical protein
MADFSTCYNFMMDNEDAPRACAVIHDPTTAYPAAQAISGINSAFYPMQFTTIAALPQSQRAAAVESFYQKEFWNKWFDALASTDVAARVFDTAVNMGPGTAVKFLQQEQFPRRRPIRCRRLLGTDYRECCQCRQSANAISGLS